MDVSYQTSVYIYIYIYINELKIDLIYIYIYIYIHLGQYQVQVVSRNLTYYYLSLTTCSHVYLLKNGHDDT